MSSGSHGDLWPQPSRHKTLPTHASLLVYLGNGNPLTSYHRHHHLRPSVTASSISLPRSLHDYNDTLASLSLPVCNTLLTSHPSVYFTVSTPSHLTSLNLPVREELFISLTAYLSLTTSLPPPPSSYLTVTTLSPSPLDYRKP